MSDYRPPADGSGPSWSDPTGPAGPPPPPGTPQGSGHEVQPYAPGPGYPPPGGPQQPPPHTGYQQPPSGMPYPQPAYGQQPRKEPAISLLVSFFVPGVGSMMNGDTNTGVGILVGYLAGLVLMICLGWILVGFIGLPISLGFWAWGMVDAYQGAVRYNQRNGYPG